MDKGVEKTMWFLTALTDVYKDEDERELFVFGKMELEEEELTDDFTRMLIALHILYERITGDKTDLLGFSHILNRLAFQYILTERESRAEEGE